MSIHAGNNNVLNLTATFVGSLPISYQWKVSPNPDGSGAVNVPGAISSTLTLANPPTNSTGYYSLQASNSLSVTPTSSSWAQVTVLPASTAMFQWSAAVPINGLTASQILCLRGTFVEAESFGASSNITVQACSGSFLFDNSGAAATLSGTAGPFGGVYTGPSTGDPNLDAFLYFDVENGSGPTLTLNNLTTGVLYSAQLFALNDIAGSSRQVNWSDPNDPADVSPSFAMGDNVYVLGTFTATNTTQSIQFNETQGGYVSGVIVRQVPPAPTLSLQRVGSSVVVTYANGILLQASSLSGPWTTNSTASPVTIPANGSRLFFRVRSP